MATVIRPYRVLDIDDIYCSIKDDYECLVDEGYDPIFGFEFSDDVYTGGYRLYRDLDHYKSDDACDFCSGCISEYDIENYFEAIESAMLNTLTKEQEARLSKEDQALYRLGWIDSSLRFTQEGKHAYLAMKMAEEYKAFAKHGISEVQRIEAEEEARKNNS